MSSDQSAVGCLGELIVGTRGAEGPGEVLLKMRGGTEAFIAWSEEPLPRGTAVLAFNSRGDRAVDVMQFSQEMDP